MKITIKSFCLLFPLTFFTNISIAQIDLIYQEPPDEIRMLADTPPPPLVNLDDKAQWAVLLHRPAFKSIEQVAAKEYRLAGLRINPKNNGSSRSRFYNKITILNIKTGTENALKGLSEKPIISNFSWSPDFKKFAFTVSELNGIELWVADKETGEATRLTKPILNDVFNGNPYIWTPDSQLLLCKFTVENRGGLIPEDQAPTGPVVQENLGQKAPARTYQDLLKNKNDEKNFAFLTTSALKKVDLSGNISDFKDPEIFFTMSFSPDGKYLMISTVHNPFSYLVPYYRFPRKTVILDGNGNHVKKLYDSPLEEVRPKGFMATSQGPRNFGWRADKPATVYWVEALDHGNPAEEADYRDAVYTLDAPFNSEAREIAKLSQRFSFIQWGNANLAMVADYWWNTRNRKVYQINPDVPEIGLKLVFDINTEDLYRFPGSFAMERNKYGKYVLLESKNNRTLYMTGPGYSPEGNKPFVAAFDTKTGFSQHIWQAEGKKTYERIIDIINIAKGDILTSIESPMENPNYFIRNIFKNTDPKQITHFPNPYASLKGVAKEQIHYKRADGTDLNATLYLPAGYEKEKDGRLPVFMWAYPREYKDASFAGQVKDSPYRFIAISYGSPLFWVVRGYAVLDRTDFPVIGEGDAEPNDTFVEQLVENGRAAIGKLTEMGIADPGRIGIGGHSYGAFMTANLLAHSDLFAAGIARSGAYNRTLTPFGFQAEERTFWEAPELYFKMSPFMHADKINEPFLMIHGTADNNSGTFPMQSERFYNAVKGHGGTVRLVMLPYESHGYAARESVMHMLWEMDNWLEKYVKNRKPVKDTKIDILNR